MKYSDNQKHSFGVCAAFEQGLKLLEITLAEDFKIEFIATCQFDDSSYVNKIQKLAVEKKINYYHKININSKSTLELFGENSIDFGFLCWWPQILKKPVIEFMRLGWINLHPSLLPKGRGKHAYFWSIVENYDMGSTIHFIDSGIDTGPILFQSKIKTSITDTGEKLYIKCVNNAIRLFKKNFRKIISGDFMAKPQPQIINLNNTRYANEINSISSIQLDKSYNALDLINIIRARTFSDGKCASFVYLGKKYEMKLKIEEVT